MATCDVWKQTHKKFHNVLSSATQDGALECMYNKSDSLWSSELLSNSIFLTIDGNVIDSYDTGDDDSYAQLVEYWNDDEHSFQLKIGDQLFCNIFHDLLNQGQVNLSDGEPDVDQVSDDDTVCGMLDDSEDADQFSFENTHFNCIPVLMMEWHEHQYVYDEDGIISDILDAPACVQSDDTLHNDDLSTIDHDAHSVVDDETETIKALLCEECEIDDAHNVSEQLQYQQKQVEVIYNNNSAMVENDPCTISVNNSNHGVHSASIVQTEISFDVDGVHSAPIEIVQQECDLINKLSSGGDEYNASPEKLELEILDGLFIPSIFNSSTTTNDPFCDTDVKQDDIKEKSPVFIIDNAPICNVDINHDDNNNNNNNIQSSDYIVIDETFYELPHDFCPLREFLDDLIKLDQQFGNQIGISLLSIKQLDLVFIGTNSNDLIFKKCIISNEFDNGGMSPEFYPLKLFLCIVEDLDIEYGDGIGIHYSYYKTLKFLFLDDVDKLIRKSHLSSLNSSAQQQQDDYQKKRCPNYKNYNKKRRKKKKRYKWIVKNKLQHPASKTFGEYDNIRNNIGNISTSDSSTDTQSIMSNGSSSGDSGYRSAPKIITARAPPCDPDEKY